MKITILAVLAFLLCGISAVAQNSYSVKGVAVDSVEKTKLAATVTILNAKDSILRKFTYAANDGTFAINGLPAGDFLLLVTYPDYADYVEGFTIKPTEKEHNFGNISMSLKSRILQEIIIKGTASLTKIKGDTTEFNAKALVIQPNDKVEDLLKQVPGMEVDQNGKVKYQGEKIDKVLLDGEEFFGDDPTLITKNIRGDMVDKFQVYDKKSDQAAFTGVDDGVKIKTLNVKLKENSKVGLFGKVTAGVGTDKYYEGQGMFNRFKEKFKFSAYGTMANDGKTSLGFDESNKLGTTSNIQISEDGGIMISFANDELESFNGVYGGRGLPVARSGGAHYDGKWNSDKESINANYKIGSLALNTDQYSITQTNIGNNIIRNRDNRQSIYNYTFRQKLDVQYKKALSPTSNLQLTIGGLLKNTESRETGVNTTSSDVALINKEVKSTNETGEQKSFNADVFYTKRFKKVGRTFSWDVNETYNEGSTTNNYKSNVDYYNPSGAVDSTQITDQYKPSYSKSMVFNSNLTFTEALSKKIMLTLNYGLGLNNSTSDRESFNQSAPGVYDVLDSVYSNNYKYNLLTNQVGATFNYRVPNVVIIFGTKASAVNYKQIDEYSTNVFKRNYVNWMPQFSLQYTIAKSKNLFVTYNGNSSQPSIGQIQPLRVNTDILNIVIGNPDLEPSFMHRFNVRYTAVQQLKNRNFSINASYSFRTNAIINNRVTDINTSKSTSRYINLKDNSPYNYNISVNQSVMVKPLDMRANVSLGTNDGVSYYYTNNALYKSDNRTYYASVFLSKNKARKYSFFASVGPNYTFQQNSQKSALNNNAYGFNANGSVTIYLPGKFQLSTDVNDNYQGKTQALPSQNTLIWNGGLSKTFLKGDNLKLSVTGNNLLDRERNTRYATDDSIIQTGYSTIKRFFMFSLSWDFTKFGTTASKN